jgi:class 3 adenylate cyclase
VLFADLKGSMELLADRDPEEARQLLDPVLEHMMAAVHRYEGTVNQIMGDGIMALFGAPLAHEDHALRACYAALAMQEGLHRYAEEVRRTQGLLVQMRVGLNSGEVVVRAIGNDLHMDYSAVGQTTHLAARMEQLAAPEGLVRVQARDPVTGRRVRLLNPCKQVWREHFRWSANGTEILGRTLCGRATVAALRLKREEITGARWLWVQAGWWPPED